MIDDELLARGRAHVERLHPQGQLAHLGVVQPLGLVALAAGVMAGPPVGQLRAPVEDRAQHLGDARVVREGAVQEAEPGDRAGGGPLPVDVERARGRVEEHRVEQVRARTEPAEQRARQGVGRQHVVGASQDEGRGVRPPLHQVQQPRVDPLR
ncbi:hypothetical protein GCM10009718_19350 [Isoptericola halotolerans]